jgi:hypothetical protein
MKLSKLVFITFSVVLAQGPPTVTSSTRAPAVSVEITSSGSAETATRVTITSSAATRVTSVAAAQAAPTLNAAPAASQGAAAAQTSTSAQETGASGVFVYRPMASSNSNAVELMKGFLFLTIGVLAVI